MKPSKVAATVVAAAGSVLALGAAAAPALAAAPAPAGQPPQTSINLNNGVDQLLSEGLRDPKPLDSNMLDTERKGSVLHSVNEVANALNKPQQQGGGQLLGGLPVGN
ncbi:hypothetical protein [Streptomyces corynorhini]|uniref:ATP-binding protein n=1 Tax=Streptomyces corynorhini TaxID=2282652 RepID=A0A370BB52_9ACTN|nr:hypothetical protein [Streptomyces corynorhini]RDG37872.1 hypothetical protein DVH02_12205 [Streptomyces corynorhini]